MVVCYFRFQEKHKLLVILKNKVLEHKLSWSEIQLSEKGQKQQQKLYANLANFV